MAAPQRKQLDRTFELAKAHTHDAERLFVLLSKDIQPREAMTTLARHGKRDSQQYRDIQAAVCKHETQMLVDLPKSTFLLINVSHEVNKRLFEGADGVRWGLREVCEVPQSC